MNVIELLTILTLSPFLNPWLGIVIVKKALSGLQEANVAVWNVVPTASISIALSTTGSVIRGYL